MVCMDPMKEFLADWLFRLEENTREAARIAELEEPIRAAHARLPQLIRDTFPKLAAGLGANYVYTPIPFFDDHHILEFSGIRVGFDLDDRAYKNPYVNLVTTLSSRHPSRQERRQVNVLELDEAEVIRVVVSALREALELRPRSIPPPWLE